MEFSAKGEVFSWRRASLAGPSTTTLCHPVQLNFTARDRPDLYTDRFLAPFLNSEQERALRTGRPRTVLGHLVPGTSGRHCGLTATASRGPNSPVRWSPPACSWSRAPVCWVIAQRTVCTVYGPSGGVAHSGS